MDKKQKLADRWLRDVHVVEAQTKDNISVYTVRPERGGGPVKILHRNLLLPFHSIPASTENETRSSESRRDRVRRQDKQENLNDSESSETED